MSKTKAQLIEELKEVKALNEAHVENNAYLQKTNAELGCRIGQLESDMAELEAFKQDSLKSLDKLSKERDFLNEAQDKNLKVIEERDNEIRVQKTTIEQQANRIREVESALEETESDRNAYADMYGVLDSLVSELMSGTVLNYIIVRWRYRRELRHIREAKKEAKA